MESTMASSLQFKEMAVTTSIIFFLIGVCKGASETSMVVSGLETDYQRSLDSRWYKLHEEPQPWDVAEQTCVQEGGHLAVLNSDKESTFLTTMMLETLVGNPSPSVLLGFSNDPNGKFTTIDGRPLEDVGFQRWSNTEKGYLGLKGGNCGSLHRDGGLSRFPCHQSAPFICERDNKTAGVLPTTTVATTTPVATTTTIPPEPASGYDYFAGLGWYKVYPKKKWHEALKVCEDDGTHLAVLNSEREASAMIRLMNKYRGRINYGICNCAFIGFHDLSHEGKFITVFGDPLESAGYLKWNYGNPDNTGNNEDCGSITYHGLLNDLSCLEEYPFICESSSNTIFYNKSVTGNVTRYHPVYEETPGVGSYKLHTDGKRWYEAIDVCEKEGAYLAIVNSDAESEVLRKIIGRNPDLELGENNNAVFLGFHDIPNKEDFTTIFGDPLNTTGFVRWESNIKTNFDCGGLSRNGRLYLMNCFSKAPFFCEQLSENDPHKGDVQREKDSSSQDYELHPGLGYYKLYLEKATWLVASRKCEQDGAHLAIINSEAESQLLRDIASANIGIKLHSSILLGFHDLSTEGHFVTIFGTPIESSGFSRWREGNPNNFGGGEDCGAMDHNGYLNDVPCDLKLQFFCEQDLNITDKKDPYVGARRMTITPEHQHVRQGGQVSIMCEAPEPLIECQFKMTNRLGIMDLSRGSASKVNTLLLDTDLTNYRYNGSGLENGQCGIVISLGSSLHRKMVGCRGRGLHGGWFYGYMSLQASNAPAMRTVASPPKEIISLENQGLKFVWDAPSTLTTCKCIFPNEGTEIILSDPFSSEEVSSKSLNSDDIQEDDYYDWSEEMKAVVVENHPMQLATVFKGVQYNGQGYKNGQCGVQFLAKKDWNGYLWCGIGTQPAFEWRSVAIILVKPPSAPVLQMNAMEHSEGAILEAECQVSGSRPMPNITWYLGGEIIRQDLLDDSPSTTWSWPFDEQVITQKLTRQLKLEDGGKELICEAANPYSSTEPVRTKQVINIGGSLLNRTFVVEEYGFEVGKPGFIVITITAHPKPDIIWHFDNITVEGERQDPSGRFVASIISKQGTLNIQWVAKLFISNVTEEDFLREFYLTATNEFGAQAYRIVITKKKTTDAPTTQSTTQTTTTTRTTTTQTTSTWSTSGPLDTTAGVTTGPDTTSGYTEYYETTVGNPNDEKEGEVFEENPAKSESSGWSTGGAIAGIVIAILIVHLSLAAVLIYGRRVGWTFIPRKARRHFGPAMSMDNLVDEDDDAH